jgi:hypothetical protein
MDEHFSLTQLLTALGTFMSPIAPVVVALIVQRGKSAPVRVKSRRRGK